jgi:hypothetical protein
VEHELLQVYENIPNPDLKRVVMCFPLLWLLSRIISHIVLLHSYFALDAGYSLFFVCTNLVSHIYKALSSLRTQFVLIGNAFCSHNRWRISRQWNRHWRYSPSNIHDSLQCWTNWDIGSACRYVVLCTHDTMYIHCE